MSQPVTIDHDTRQITFQIGKTIPPTDMRANYHRLLDLALDALAMSAAEDSKIAAQIAADPDVAPECDEAWFADARLVMPKEIR